MTYAQKLGKYRRGEYMFPPPPITHAYWNDERWVDYIDAYGEWF